MPEAAAHLGSGKVKALAVTSLERSPQAPNLPTLDESGLKGYEAQVWAGLLAPDGTPPAIVTRLNGEMVKILKMPDIIKNLTSDGGDIVGSTPEQFDALMRAEVAKWAEVVKFSGAKAE